MSKIMKLRAFKINNLSLTISQSDLDKRLLEKLNGSEKSQERCMLLSPEDEAREQDLISYYMSYGEKQSLFCTLLRMAPGDNVQHITNTLLQEPKFSIENIENEQLNTEAIYQYHYDFSIKGNFLVTNLRGNITIKRLETYLSWYLRDESLSLVPMVETPEGTKLSDIATATFGDAKYTPPDGNQAPSAPKSKLLTLAKERLADLLNDNESLSEMDLDEILSAELLIKFKKPRKMTQEEYEQKLGSLLKPVADAENVTLKTKDNKKFVSGRDILLSKTVQLETTESGHVVEQQLVQSMAKFLDELIEKDKTKLKNENSA